MNTKPILILSLTLAFAIAMGGCANSGTEATPQPKASGARGMSPAMEEKTSSTHH
jgi:hypothetical protein